MGMARRPAARVTANKRMKSEVGSSEDHVSMGYIIFNANVAPERERLIM